MADFRREGRIVNEGRICKSKTGQERKEHSVREQRMLRESEDDYKDTYFVHIKKSHRDFPVNKITYDRQLILLVDHLFFDANLVSRTTQARITESFS
jgi:hypothetical protein